MGTIPMAATTTREVPKARVLELTAVEEERFRKARARSKQLWEDARKVLPRGVPSSFQDAAPQPIFIEHGKGSLVWDVDGNEYVDFHNGFGVMVVGHAHPKIVDAVRIARGFTGRERLIKIEASYHGHHDALMVSVEPPPDLMGAPDHPASVPQSEGIPAAIVELTTVVPFNDLDALETAFVQHAGEVAAVIVEPAMMNVGIVLPDAGYLGKLKEIAHRHGALLIFDEVKTGVTIAPGGATDRFQVTPDLVALAKAIGGGLPCGAVGGREDVMGVVEEKRVAQMGTFNGNPLTMAASRVTLLEILDGNAYAHFDALAETLQGGLDEAIGSYELPFHVTTLAARGGVTYRAQRVRNYRDYLEIDKSLAYLSWLYQSNRGVLMAPGAEENWTLSVQHSAEDVQRYVDNFAEMAKDFRH